MKGQKKRPRKGASIWAVRSIRCTCVRCAALPRARRKADKFSIPHANLNFGAQRQQASTLGYYPFSRCDMKKKERRETEMYRNQKRTEKLRVVKCQNSERKRSRFNFESFFFFLTHFPTTSTSISQKINCRRNSIYTAAPRKEKNHCGKTRGWWSVEQGGGIYNDGTPKQGL